MCRAVAVAVALLLAAGLVSAIHVGDRDEPTQLAADVTQGSPAIVDDRGEREERAVAAALEEWVSSREDVSEIVVAAAATGSTEEPWIVDTARPGDGTLIDDEDVYGVLSITKTFTEALVLREVAHRRIDLDAPMPSLPGVTEAPPGVRITPRMLLQHSSGLVDYRAARGYDPSQPITPEEIVSLGLASPLLSEPGTKAEYSNTNFHWLGLLLEHVTGENFSDLVDDLASELGLHDTRLGAAPRPGWVGFASGGVTSTVEDIARWAAALFTPGRVLDADGVDLLTELSHLGVTHGLWPVCACEPGHQAGESPPALAQLVAHGGVVFYPDADLVVVVRRDRADGRADLTVAVADAVREALSREAATRPPEPASGRRAW